MPERRTPTQRFFDWLCPLAHSHIVGALGKFCVSATILSGLLLLTVHTARAGVTIQNIDVSKREDATRILIQLSGSSAYDIYPLSRPDRIVVDFEGIGSEKPRRVNAFPIGQVAALRTGSSGPGLLRLVFDLNGPATIEHTYVLRGENGARHLSIRIAPASDNLLTPSHDPLTKINLATRAVLPAQGSSSQLPTSSPEAAPSALSGGYTWGQVRFPSSLLIEERTNGIVEGAVFHGLYYSITDDIYFNPFVQFYFQRDTEGFDYYNSLRPAVGAQIGFTFFNSASVLLGVRQEWDYKRITHRWSDKAVGFLSWTASWQRQAAGVTDGFQPHRYFAYTRGEILYPSSHEVKERNNLVISSASEFGVDLWTYQNLFTFNAVLELGYKADTERLDFNNWVQSAIGAKLQLSPSSMTIVEIGVKYAYEYRFLTHQSYSWPIVVSNWVGSW